MKPIFIINVIILSIGLLLPNSGIAQLATETSFTLNGVGRLINDDSRLNPENTVQDLDNGEASLEAHLSVSDYLNDAETLRWLLKTYGFYSSATDTNDNRQNVTRIDEAFVDWNGGDWFVSLGKRRISWGHALAFNPVNVIVPPRDPLNPNQATEGQPAIWGSYSRNVGSLNLYYTRDFDKNWDSDLNRWGARLNGVFGESDFSLYYFDGEPYQNDRDYERLFGASFSTNLWAGTTLYAEVVGTMHNYRNYYVADGTADLKDEFTAQAVLGSYILLDPESFLSFFKGDASLLLEVYYNGSGYSESEREAYFDVLARSLQTGDPAALHDYRFTGMNQFYALATYRNSFKERYTLELTGLVAQDWSFSAQAQLRYNLSDYYSLTAQVAHNQGGSASEFGNAPVTDQFELEIDITW